MENIIKALVRAVPLLFATWGFALLPPQATTGIHSAGGSASQSVQMTDIKFSALPGSRFEVRMRFSGGVPEPQGYAIDKPARLVLDFPNVESRLKEKRYTLSFGNAKSANVLSDGKRTRLILNMIEMDSYQTRTEDDSFILTVGKDKLGEMIKKSSSVADRLSSDTPKNSKSINNVDFRRGEAGEGKVIVSLSDPHVGAAVENVNGQIVLRFADTELPVNLRLKLDVTDFAAPVSAISSDYIGTDSVISIKPTGEYDYLAYQTDTEYVVSVKPLNAKEQDTRKQKFSYVGEKLSLNFQDIPLRSVLQLVADFAELNLVASDTVEGKITLRLEDVPWDQALDLVLKTKGLDKRQVGNVLMVAPAAEIAAREREQLETNKQLQALAPMHTEHVQILYADAAVVFKLLSNKEGGAAEESAQSLMSSRGSASLDERTNSIIITETDAKIQQFRELVKRIDIPVRQVSIEARIVKASSSFTKDLGVSWGVERLKDNGSTVRVSNKLKDPVSGGLDGTGKMQTVTDLSAGAGASSLALGILQGDDTMLGVELSALESSGHGEIVSQPKVITGDKQKAVIKSGQEIGYLEASSSGAATVSFKEAVLKLEVTPQITQDDKIIMNIVVSKDSIKEYINVPSDGGGTTQTPVLDTMQLDTSVLVDNGQTIVLGGIFESSSDNTRRKVPFLGDLPVIGALFSSSVTKDNRTELLIFVTPRLLQSPFLDKH